MIKLSIKITTLPLMEGSRKAVKPSTTCFVGLLLTALRLYTNKYKSNNIGSKRAL
jgi:hypothetical protein